MDRVLRRRDSALLAWMAAISTSLNPASANDADQVGGIPTKLVMDQYDDGKHAQ